MELHKSLYGKTALSAGGVGLGTQIVESAELFDLQKTTKKESDVKSVHDHNGLTNAERKTQQTLTNGTTMNTPSKVCPLYFTAVMKFPAICFVFICSIFLSAHH